MATSTGQKSTPVEASAPEQAEAAEAAEEQAQMLVKLPASLYHAFQVVALVKNTKVATLVRAFVEGEVKANRPVIDAIEAAQEQVVKS